MIWSHNKKDGRVTTALVYDLIVKSHLVPSEDKIMAGLWRHCFPLKIKCFVWLALKNQVLTWDNLMARGWQGPGCCGLYLSGEDSVHHLFVDCSVTRSVFSFMGCSHHCKWLVSDSSLGSLLDSWSRKNPSQYYMPFFVF